MNLGHQPKNKKQDNLNWFVDKFFGDGMQSTLRTQRQPISNLVILIFAIRNSGSFYCFIVDQIRRTTRIFTAGRKLCRHFSCSPSLLLTNRNDNESLKESALHLSPCIHALKTYYRQRSFNALFVCHSHYKYQYSKSCCQCVCMSMNEQMKRILSS